MTLSAQYNSKPKGKLKDSIELELKSVNYFVFCIILVSVNICTEPKIFCVDVYIVKLEFAIVSSFG